MKKTTTSPGLSTQTANLTKTKPTCHKLTIEAPGIRRLVKLSGKWVKQSEVGQRRAARIHAKGKGLTSSQAADYSAALVLEHAAAQLRDLLRTLGVTREDIYKLCQRQPQKRRGR